MSKAISFPRITLRQFEQLISSQTVTIPELTAYCRALAVAGEDVWQLHAYNTILDASDIQQQAQASQERWNAGKPLSCIDGLPVSIKANLAVATQPLTAGSAILGASTAFSPAVGYTADVVQSLQNNGAIIMGITQMDEFGMGSLGTNLASGKPTKNPLSFFPDTCTRIRDLANKNNPNDIVKAIRAPFEQICDQHEQMATAACSQTPVSAGGSSCGSAASVAHGSSLLSLGSDTGGSVRLPAAWCGLVGIRPTYGRLSRHGLVSYASSFDTVGVLANSADCIDRAFPHIMGCNDTTRDSNLSTSAPFTSSLQDSKNANLPLEGLKVGIPEAFSVAECPAHVSDAWHYSADLMNQAGACVEIIPQSTISTKVLQQSLSSYFILVSAEASSNLARYDGFRYGCNVPDAASNWKEETGGEVDTTAFTLLEHQYASARTAGFGPEVIRRILCGTAALSSDRFHTHYEGAARLRSDLTSQLRAALDDYDLLLVPTVLFSSPRLDTIPDPTEVFANDVMTIPASLAGLPALSVPVVGGGTSCSGAGTVPSIQLIGRAFDESLLLKVAATIDNR